MVKTPSKITKKHPLENPDEISPKKTKTTSIKPNNNNEKVVINLYCSAVSKRGEIVVSGEQKIELGRIGSLFGIEPGSVKLNGYFIGSRGFDYIATSVTWNSLLSFFSSKGFSTGLLSSSPILVGGKVLKCASKKRSRDEIDVDTEGDSIKQCGEVVCRLPHCEEINSPNSKKFKESNNAHGRGRPTARQCNNGLKRRHWVEDTSPFKKSRTNGGYSNENPLDDLPDDSDTPIGVNESLGSSKRSFEDDGSEANTVTSTMCPVDRDTTKRQKSKLTDSSSTPSLDIGKHLECIRISRHEAHMERMERENRRIEQREREIDMKLYRYLNAKINRSVEEENGRTNLMTKLFS